MEEEVIQRYIRHYGQPDRKEEALIRETTKWAIQEYLSSESFEDWKKEKEFLMNSNNYNKFIWWVKIFRTSLDLILWCVLMSVIFKGLSSMF